jgi:OOP family OmpA-OmpF porin
MRASSIFLAIATLLCAAAAAAYVGVLGADLIERQSESDTAEALHAAGHDWVVVEVDGLIVRLSGTAQSEAQRFSALGAVGEVVEASRIIDKMDVIEPAPPAPDFAIELLRNTEGVSLIGLVPLDFDTGHVLAVLAEGQGAPVADLMETADFPIPAGFETAADFAARAALILPRSKISVTAEQVSVTAATDSPEDRDRLETALTRLASDSFTLALNLSAPRPVVTPFTLRFLRDGEGARFDACTADSDAARDAILNAAAQAGQTGQTECIVGLGTPTPTWGAAAETAIAALAEIGQGSVTFSDADVTLIASSDTPQEVFDRVAGELQADLPPAFSLHAVLTPKPADPSQVAEPPEFVATRSPEGQVQLRGRVTDDLMRQAVESFAQARFGAENVYVATRPDAALPNGWPVRVLAGLDALAHTAFGSVIVQPDLVSLRGTTGDADARATIARRLSERLGEAQNFDLNVNYLETLDPVALLPTPEECLARLQAVQSEAKIAFEPGSANIHPDTEHLLDQLAAAMTDCETVPIEVGGHTDSQGRESMNLTLSQARADAVIGALLARRVLTGSLVARGYGESQPIADNGTEEGRETNRRIEFLLTTEAAARQARLEAAAEAEGATDETGEDNDTN